MEIFSNLCRCCNSEKQNVLNIYDSNSGGDSPSIADMLEYCLQATIINDSRYPTSICYDCVKQLEISYRFIKRFQLAQREFEEAFNHLEKINEETGRSDSFKEEFLEESDEVNTDPQITEKMAHTDIDLPLKYVPINQVHDAEDSRELEVVCTAPSADSPPDITCYICHKTFFTAKALNLHLKLSHKQKHFHSQDEF